MQQQPHHAGQKKPSFIDSALQKLEQAAPGITQQVERFMESVGVSSNAASTSRASFQAPSYYNNPGMPPYPAVQQPTYLPPGSQAGYGYSPYPAHYPAASPQQGPCPYLQYPVYQQAYPYPYQPVYAPITQVYPQVPDRGSYAPPGAALGPYAAAPVQYSTQHQAWQAGQVHPQQPQQQHPAGYDIPFIEATVCLKPSSLPISSSRGVSAAAIGTASSAAAGTTATQQQQQQDVLQRLQAAAVPAAAQGAAAAGLVGRWYHHDAGLLSELTLKADGCMIWEKSSSTAAAAATEPLVNPHAAAPEAPNTSSSSSNADVQSRPTVERLCGIWRHLQGNQSKGIFQLTFVTQQQQQQEQQQQGQQQYSSPGGLTQQQQQHVVAYHKPALEDTLMLDGLAHVKLGPA